MTARTRVRRGALAGIGAVALTTATVLAGPSAVAAEPAGDSSAPTATEEASGADSGDMASTDMDRDGIDRWIPEDLQQALHDLQDLPADERAAAVQDLVSGALSGEYGEDVESLTEDLQGVWSSLPTDLRSDLASAFGQEPEQVGQELSQVYENARDGEYGQGAQAWTDWVSGTVSSWDVGDLMGTGSE